MSNKIIKKIFGGVNLTWPKVIIMAIVIGIYTAVMVMLEITKDTSFSDLAVTFEVWIFFGIFIIMNSKSAKDSALKCFIFFLISQPLIYLVQDVINGSSLFMTYYRNWIPFTIGCLPMGFIGYYMKKDKWWGLLILLPIMILLGLQLSIYTSYTIFSFPRHLLTVLFCIVTLILYPLAIFNNKKIRITGAVIGCLIALVFIILNFIKLPVYSTDILVSGNEYNFDNTYHAYLVDSKYGDLSFRYEEGIESWLVHAELKKAGKTQFVLESPSGEKRTFDITIKRDTYIIEEVI